MCVGHSELVSALTMFCVGEKNSREVLLLLLNDETIDINILNQCDETAYDIAKRLSRHSHLFAIAASHINIC